MIAEFLDEAEQELVEAVLWYESKEMGLGKRFRLEVAMYWVVSSKILCFGVNDQVDIDMLTALSFHITSLILSEIRKYLLSS